MRVHDPRAGRAHRVGDRLRAQPASDEPRGSRRAAEIGRVALHERRGLAEVPLGQPAQVGHHALLAAGRPVPVMEEEDHV